MTLPLRQPFAPMEALPVDTIPVGQAWRYEPKWDGFRCLAFRDGYMNPREVTQTNMAAQETSGVLKSKAGAIPASPRAVRMKGWSHLVWRRPLAFREMGDPAPLGAAVSGADTRLGRRCQYGDLKPT